MTERLADLLQGRTALHQIGREAVPEDVRAHIRGGRCEARMRKSLLQNGIKDLTILEWSLGWPCRHEEHPGRRDPIAPDILGQCLADLGQEG